MLQVQRVVCGVCVLNYMHHDICQSRGGIMNFMMGVRAADERSRAFDVVCWG